MHSIHENMVKSRGFYRNVDQFTTTFHPLCWLKSVSLRLENYLPVNRIVSETANVMLLFSQSSEFKSTTERFWGSTWFIHFDGPSNYYHSFQTPLSLIMANVVYLIRDTSDITLRNLLKQDLTHSSITL